MANASGCNETAPPNRQLVRKKGLEYCREQLSRLGWSVEPAAHNVRSVDFIVRSRDASRSVEIKVRTLSKRNAVGLGLSLGKVMGDFWVIVSNVATPDPSFFVLLPQEVKELASRDEGGKRQYWLERRDYEQEQFREAWERIGRGDA